MHAHESAVLITQLAATYSAEVTPERTRIWQKKLAPLDVEVALVALETVIDKCKWHPQWAEFLEHYRAAQRRTAVASNVLEDVTASAVPDGIFAKLRAAYSLPVPPTVDQAEDLLDELVDGWGPFEDAETRADWLARFRRMDFEWLVEAAGLGLRRWRGMRPSFTAFSNHCYLEAVDRDTLRRIGMPDAKTLGPR